MAKSKFTDDDAALLAELGVEAKPVKTAKYTPRQERIIAGFEEIQRFVAEHGRLPRHGEERDIFERLYAVRLDRLRELDECRELLAPFDTENLLTRVEANDVVVSPETTDAELLSALGVSAEATPEVAQLKHVRSRAEINAADEIARRTPCTDFEIFRPVFEEVARDLKSGRRRTVKYQDNAEVKTGDLFILEGLTVYIALMGEPFVPPHGRTDRRLRVIYDNATESDLLLRSLQRALNKDETSRRIVPTEEETMPLFSDQIAAEDTESGYIYVARSKSDNPFIAEQRQVVHKIGVTGQEPKKRVAGAKKDATFLLAEVELVASYHLANINRKKLEEVLHHFFAAARIDLELRDRFSAKVEPREWFLVPLPVIEQAIEMLMHGEIEHCQYDPQRGQIIDTRTNEPCA